MKSTFQSHVTHILCRRMRMALAGLMGRLGWFAGRAWCDGGQGGVASRVGCYGWRV